MNLLKQKPQTSLDKNIRDFTIEVEALKIDFKKAWKVREEKRIKTFLENKPGVTRYFENSWIVKNKTFVFFGLPNNVQQYFKIQRCYEDGQVAGKDDFSFTDYKLWTLKENFEYLLEVNAEKTTEEVFDFYYTRVSEKVKDINEASKIKTFTIKKVYLSSSNYPETLIHIETESKAKALISTTVESAISSIGNFFLRFPTRFHNMEKNGEVKKSPSWKNFIKLSLEVA